MHRAIQPFHTKQDRDTLFAMTTNAVDIDVDAGAPGLALGALASEPAWDGVMAAVR